MKNAFENIMKAKVQSILAIMIVAAFLGLFYIADVKTENITYLGTIVTVIVTSYFKNNDDSKKD